MAIPHSTKFYGLLPDFKTGSRLMKKPSAKARGKTKRPNKVDFLKARGKVVRPKPFEKSSKVDFSKFEAVPSASDIAKLAWAARPKVWQQPPIEVLSPAKTVGLGGTSLS